MTTATRARTRTVRRGGMLLAAATATVLYTTSFAAPAFADERPGASSFELIDGTLDWGVKASFNRYISGPIAGGSITTADGAETNADSTFRFTNGTGGYDLPTHGVDTAFDGSVHYEGHHGALDVKFSDLRVVTEGTAGAIVADITVAGEVTEDVEVAGLDLSSVRPGSGDGGAMVLADIPATLTKAGEQAFSYNGSPMYPEGTELDPATLTVTPKTAEPDPEPENPENPENPEKPEKPENPETPGNPDGENPVDDEPDAEDPIPAGVIHDGTLDWGVKESFRTYISGPIAHGDVELADGAVHSGDGYRFTDAEGEFDTTGETLGAAFDGSVRFFGHAEAGGGYALDLTFSDFAVEIDGTQGELIADVVTKDGTYDAVTVADLDIPAGALTSEDDVIVLTDIPATLTAEGSEAFAYNGTAMYPAGTALDTLTVTVALSEDAELPPGENPGGTGSLTTPAGTTPQGGALGGALASTGSGIPLAELAGGAAALSAAGVAAFYAARRRRLSLG
ncbi:HtaA domain-containing protein [Streptomyces xiamenensis]|uniref:HtaA domain-containing protein n=1 Tax=Streptomyces xiamenensis TaxID=408015 RepID=UPI003D710458